MYPSDLKYTKEHEWIRLSDGDAQVGITEYAQKQLGDIVYLELPEAGRSLRKGEVFGTVESVKAVSELFSPISGEVTDVNSRLAEKPESVNSDPHGSWMIAIRPSNPDEVGELLDAAAYGELTK